MIHFLLVLAICGFVVWVVLQIPMPPLFRNIIMGVLAICLVVWALQHLGFATGFSRIGL